MSQKQHTAQMVLQGGALKQKQVQSTMFKKLSSNSN